MKNFRIEIRLDESYIDSINGTLTVEMYKYWEDRWGKFERLLASLPGIPYDQAKAMMNACNKAGGNVNKSSVLPFKLVVDNTNV